MKRVALTDIEVANPRSTADLYGFHVVPLRGRFRRRRGLARTGHAPHGDRVGPRRRCENFPLLHHWRILPGLPRPRADIERDVAFWHGDPGVRRRLEALAGATTDLVLFLEHLPHNLAGWPADPTTCRSRGTSRHITEFLAGQGVQHFDAHFANIVTDGERLYLTDFGLRGVLAVRPLGGRGGVPRRARRPRPGLRADPAGQRVVRGLASGRMPAPATPSSAMRRGRGAGSRTDPARYAPLAAVVNDFYFGLHVESRKTPYRPRKSLSSWSAPACPRTGRPGS